MKFDMNCSFCNVNLEADESMIGQSLTCPSCSNEIVIEKPLVLVEGKKENNNYPVICVIAGVLMLINALLLFYQAIEVRGNGIQKGVKVFLAIVFILGGIGFIAKQKFGQISGIISMVLFLLGALLVIVFGGVSNINSAIMIAIVINAAQHVLILFGVLHYNDWEKKKNNPQVLVNCPSCDILVKSKYTPRKNKKVKCVNCAEIFYCKA